MKKNIVLSDLPPEMRAMIDRGEDMVEKTRSTLKKRGLNIDITCRFQLESDCKSVEKYISAIQKGKAKPKSIEELNLAMIRLQTTRDGIL
ncbi:MAG: hypothetical protein EOM40_08975 [Clostridia bacterium]|nr:hypothetical protein [Clostridia bacterium]NCC42121.1 hypothetical protein [Clostridia bacterium]